MKKRTPLEGFMRYANRLVERLVRWGLPMGARRAPMALLTVRGRKSGLLRTVPVALAPAAGGWTLISVYGVSDWSRNLEAAGAATITMRGSTTEVVVERLAPGVAAPILRDELSRAPWMVRKMTAQCYAAETDSPIKDWEHEAVTHPVFRLSPSAPAPSHAAPADS